ncbi:peptide ABC transporter substrate-binding protein [Leucobacter allii]|uniref:Peptide ABC transporter substrate-binding protein n=1 Tax=Leucobacter allii TaxID=2932247 RepID=A0ABY4FL54_9MICO|nr:peptide ABC transporter substrate-binding protein [Leucobacter allii]UOQ56991.1 peptide ABC transporter substrate-binding protein [Leucobacter allii]
MNSSSRPRRAAQAIAAGAAIAVAMVGCAASPGGDAAPEAGGIAVVALTQEPGMLSPMFNTQSGSNLTFAFVVEPLFTTLDTGERVANLAAEIPTRENGMVSEDGLTVTYALHDGITWSDGEPFTADDLAFTIDVTKEPGTLAIPDPEYASVASYEVVDPQTIAVTFVAPQPNYLNLFRQVLPKHRFDGPSIAEDDPELREPTGTGPFVIDKWTSGDEIAFVRNEHYWRTDTPPLLDGVTVKINPDLTTAVNGFTRGEFDLVFGLTAGDLDEVAAAVDSGAPIELHEKPENTGFVEWLWLNNSAGGQLGTPHPVLGDPAIREAIDLGIDREGILEDVLGGFGTLSNSLVYSGFGGELTETAPFDPEAAREVLEDAGWTLGGDGVRSKDGVRASVKFQTISGDEVRALYQQVIQQNLKDIGIETVIENVPSNLMFGDAADGGLLATGDFDIMMSRAGKLPDPSEWMMEFASARIPSGPDTPGYSYAWWSNAEYDALVDTVNSELDPELREQAVHEANRLFAAERPAIPIYASPTAWAWSSQLSGVTDDSWNGPWDTTSSVHWSFSGSGE